MKEGQPSHTADRVAERRAAHQLLDDPRVFEDPLALQLIRPEVAAKLRDDPNGHDPSPVAPYRRAFFAVRSRFTEDGLADVVGQGVRQYVLLGAGYDTFAYRNPFGQSLRVFEVDHPDTQREKQRRLSQAGIDVAGSVTFVPVDFGRQSPEEELKVAGLDTSMAAFFAWLGVVPYLDPGEIEVSLRFIASLPPGTSVVFDYSVPRSSMNERQRRIFDQVAGRVAALGEPFKTFFEPDELAQRLRQLGFSAIEDHDAATLNARYFANRRDGLRLAGAARIVKATV